ncbi:hypothetical protein GTP56_20790 [Duganella sp. FT134W]|uniref:Uncharacterized protein n=1 Tax=Duganella margarita TaxID=2692170 RepID=A0A7X4H3E7_9BURK|nr:hypothetical protein [Duganella margarita]MYM74613.1 hypothetical protein [Duganella margarita]
MSDAAATLDANASVKAVPISARRTVCYTFDTTASKAKFLALPYLVSIDGKIQNAKARTLDSSRQIKLIVNAGSKVALYLNSDVHPDYRLNPVYEVITGDHDVLVNIVEKKGHWGQLKPVVGEAAFHPSNPRVAFYQASLTGDIWKGISHRYTESEANSLIPEDTPTVVRDAVCSIYRGLAGAMLKILHHKSQDTGFLVVQFQRPGNAEENIENCFLLKDVLPRTHPCAFAALFNAACIVGATEMLVTSSWRPMHGSILHRAGLGLDVTTIRDAEGKVQINREGLTEPGHSKNPNVSDQEKDFYNQFQNAPKSNKENKSGYASGELRKKWESEVPKSEPKLMRKLRDTLGKQKSVKQIFDPWYMQSNTNIGKVTANAQLSSNETTHDDHLHLTIWEPDIYE